MLKRLFQKSIFMPFFGFFKLREARGRRWAELVEHIGTLKVTSAEVIAFNLTVDRLRRAQGKRHHAHGAMICASCSLDIINDFEGTEDELVALYYHNLADVNRAMGILESTAVAAAA